MGVTSPTRVKGSDRADMSRVVAGLVGLASVLAAVGLSHVVAAVIAPASWPFQAVVDTVVRLSPAGLTEFGKSLDFPSIGLPRGTADKTLLQVVVTVALVVIGLLAGLVSRSRRRPGLLVIAGLGVVGLAAVATSPVFSPGGLVAPLVALGVGVGVFAWLYARAARSVPGRTSAAGASTMSRRGVLLSSAAVGAGGLAAAVAGYLLGGGGSASSRAGLMGRLRPRVAAPPIPAGADFVELGTPRFLTANRDFYRIDVATQIPDQAAEDWSLRIHGLVDRELRISYDQLLARPLVEKTITITCVSNEINGNLISTSNFTGVSLRDLLLEAGVRPGAEQLFSTSIDGWTAGTPTGAVLEPGRGALLAVAMNGEPLPAEHGFPVRMVVPGLYGFVSATKWLADLELTTFAAKQSYWLRRGWAQQAPIKTQSRIDQPQGFRTLTRGRDGTVALAGIAWAQTRGINKVEVRIDETGPWLPAQLSTEVNPQTWRMWRYNAALAPGSHYVQSRATDTTGYTQTPMPAPPIPDGAAGWPGISFSVA